MSIELVMNENHLIQPSQPLLPASPPEGGLGIAIWQLGWRDCTPPAGNPPALLVWQEGADCNSLGLPNDLGRGWRGLTKAHPPESWWCCPRPCPATCLSEKLSWWMFHRWLNRMCTLRLLGETFHKSQSYYICWLMVFLNPCICLLISCLAALSIIERGIEVSKYNCGFVYFSSQFSVLSHIFRSSVIWCICV